MSIKIKTADPSLDKPTTLLFGGDFCPIRRYEEKILREEPIFSTALLQHFKKSDFFIVNLESPLCNTIFSNSVPGVQQKEVFN